MDSNPFDAAGAALDMSRHELAAQRPRSVKRLVDLASVGAAINLLVIVFSVMQSADPLRFHVLPPALGVVALNILLIYKLHQGKAWARAICIVLAIIGAVAGLLQLDPRLNWDDTASGICHLALYLAMLSLLFVRPTRDWFEAMQRMPAEGPARKALETPDSQA
jgi:hypothetical protein